MQHQRRISMSGLVHSSRHLVPKTLGSSDQGERRRSGLSPVLEPARWGDVIHVYSSITSWRSAVCSNTGVGRLCRSQHQESLLFVLRLQNSLVGRRAPREILSSEAMHYKEYRNNDGFDSDNPFLKKVFFLLPSLFLVLTSVFLSQHLLLSLKLCRLISLSAF